MLNLILNGHIAGVPILEGSDAVNNAGSGLVSTSRPVNKTQGTIG